MQNITTSIRGNRLPKYVLGRSREFYANALSDSMPSPVDRSLAELQVIVDRRDEYASVAA